MGISFAFVEKQASAADSAWWQRVVKLGLMALQTVDYLVEKQASAADQDLAWWLCRLAWWQRCIAQKESQEWGASA